ncbi:MAG: extracellular solute-binding protein [Oscillospiraceae bacterium]|jgi:hypothetical protein|nr:extracellular solute-binding protein [Oscillospiraceae bacterium]
MKTRQIITLLLAAAMLCALVAACGGSSSPSGSGASPSDQPGVRDRYETTREILVGIWWMNDIRFTSDRKDYSLENATNQYNAQLQWDAITAVENLYNIKFNMVDMTFDGARESIFTSIAAGTPDVDIYCLDPQFLLTPIRNNYCLALEDFLPADHDIFNDMLVMNSMKLMGQDKTYVFAPTPLMDQNNNGGGMMGFNWTLLQERGVTENPQDLYDRGEWTWNNWIEMMRTITSPAENVWGWSGGHEQSFIRFLFSNNAYVASGPTQTLNSPATLEVLQLIYDLYNTWNLAKPWDNEVDYWDMQAWNKRDLGFFYFVPWLAQDTRPWGTSMSEQCPDEIRTVPFPIGPVAQSEGLKAYANVADSNMYMIPTGTKDPEVVLDVFYRYLHWWGDDTTLRDDVDWIKDLMYEFVDDRPGEDPLRGFDYLTEMLTMPGFEMWKMLQIRDEERDAGFGIGAILDGSNTPAQFAEQWQGIVQTYLDAVFK